MLKKNQDNQSINIPHSFQLLNRCYSINIDHNRQRIHFFVISITSLWFSSNHMACHKSWMITVYLSSDLLCFSKSNTANGFRILSLPPWMHRYGVSSYEYLCLHWYMLESSAHDVDVHTFPVYISLSCFL